MTRENPILECELPLDSPFDGSRFEALIPPVVRKREPMAAYRFGGWYEMLPVGLVRAG